MLPTTEAELEKTRAHHVETISKADRVLRDYQAFDGAIRVVIVRKP